MTELSELARAVRAYVEEQSLPLPSPNGRPVLLAMSGGMDSTVLAHIFQELDWPFEIAHINYRLRGADSDADEAFVRRLGLTWDIPVHVLRIKKGVSGGTDNIQGWAREIRYEYFEKLLDEERLSSVVTAHKLDDDLETSLLNLSRATGIAGLRGMRAFRDYVMRPLLNTPHREILAYAEARAIQYRHDYSNDTDNYRRNAIRHHVIPIMRDYGLTDNGWRATKKRLLLQQRLYLRMLEQLADTLFTNPERTIINRARLEQMPRDEANDVLWYSLSNLRLQRHQIDYFFDYRAGRPLIDLGTCRIQIGDAVISILPPRETRQLGKISVDQLPFVLEFLNQRIELLPTTGAPAFAQNKLYTHPLPTPLYLRGRRPGDRFQPFGLKGKSKKVKDFLIDRKLTELEKNNLCLLTTGEDKIIAILGLEIDWRWRIRDTDQEHCVLSVTPT